MSQSILDALEDVPKGQNSIMKENMSAIKKLLTQQDLQTHAGWKIPSELSITCLDVRRDEDIFEDSELA